METIIDMRVMCFHEELSDIETTFNMYSRSRPGVNPQPPPAPNLVEINHVPSETTSGLLFSDNGPLSSNNPEHRESWFGFRPINSHYKRHVIFDSGPRKSRANASHTIKEGVFGYSVRRRNYVAYDQKQAQPIDPVRLRERQTPIWWVGFYYPTLATTENTPGRPLLVGDHAGLNDQGADDQNKGDDAPTGALIRIQRFYGNCRWTEAPF